MIFELFASGEHSKTEILKKVNALGLRTKHGKCISPQTLDKVLRNPLYAGWMVVEKWNIRMKGNFEPLISEMLFDATQSLITGEAVVPRRREKDSSDFPLRRFVKCRTCGTPLTASWSTGARAVT